MDGRGATSAVWPVMDSSTAGRLLVASPQIGDPNFHRTVVLVLQHDADGALGLILNRPSDTFVDEVLPAWADHVTAPGRVFVGGPVERSAAICLGLRRGGTEPPGWSQASGDFGTVDLDADPGALVAELCAIRVFAGYSGWGPSQLDGELEAGGWFVVPAREVDPFSDDPDDLWRQILARQDGRLKFVASFPEDPSTN